MDVFVRIIFLFQCFPLFFELQLGNFHGHHSDSSYNDISLKRLPKISDISHITKCYTKFFNQGKQ